MDCLNPQWRQSRNHFQVVAHVLKQCQLALFQWRLKVSILPPRTEVGNYAGQIFEDFSLQNPWPLAAQLGRICLCRSKLNGQNWSGVGKLRSGERFEDTRGGCWTIGIPVNYWVRCSKLIIQVTGLSRR